MYILRYFADETGFLVQKHNDKINAVDSNFLTTNALYQASVSGDDKWLDSLSVKACSILAIHRFMKDGKLIRYQKNIDTEEGKLWTDPRTVSRDNSLGYIILAGHLGESNRLKSYALDILKRGSFFQNTHTTKGERKFLPDFCGPGAWSIILRAIFQNRTSKLILYPLDFFWSLSLILHVLKSHTKYFQTSTCFHEVSAIIQSKLTVQTLFSRIGSHVYLNYRKKFDEPYYDDNGVVSALKYYSRAKYDPPIYEITKNALKEIK